MEKTIRIQIGSIIVGLLIITYSLGQVTKQGVYLGFSIPVFFQILSLISKLRKTRYNFLLNMPPILKI